MVGRNIAVWGLTLVLVLSMTTGVEAQEEAAEPEKPPVPTQDKEAIAAADEAIQLYYAGQKRGSIGYLSVGAASILAGAGLAFSDSELVTAAGWTTAGLGLLNVAAGAYVLSVVDEQQASAQQLLADDPIAFKEQEMQHMLDKGFQTRLYYTLDALFILGGVSTTVIGLIQDNDTVRGIGIGTTAQGGVNAIMHGVGSFRSGAYFEALQSFEAVDPNGDPTKASLSGAIIGFQGQF
ncbi:MAG: hypothetical protein AAFX99_22755 [Myxococcota bacterium]